MLGDDYLAQRPRHIATSDDVDEFLERLAQKRAQEKAAKKAPKKPKK